MDKKALSLKRYKRLFQLTNDHSWMAKYAQEGEAVEDKPYTLPTVKEFTQHIIFANSKAFENDPLQGQLGNVVAKELVKHYNSSLDPDEIALKSIKPEEDLERALTDDVLKFSKEEEKALLRSVQSSMRKLGDAHLSSLSEELDRGKLQNLVQFVLGRAYISQYWMFLFNNPIVTVLLENEKNKPLSISSALTKHQIIANAEEEEEEGILYEETPEDILEEEREGSYPKSVEKALEKRKSKRKIQEYPGKKIRLSQLIEAFKISRAKWAVRLLKDPENTKLRAGWLATDANIDYLERAFQALKDFVAQNPNNRFLKWHGQRIGDGDVFVLTTGANFDTLKMMTPPPFKVGYKKIDSYNPETGRKIKELNLEALRIPVKMWNPDAKDNSLNVFLPEFPDIFDFYAHQKLADPAAYQQEIREKAFSDLKMLHEYNLSNSVDQDSLMSDHIGSSKDQMQKRVLFDPNVPKAIQFGGDEPVDLYPPLGDPDLTRICNLTWKKVHGLISEVFESSITPEDLDFGLSNVAIKAVDVIKEDGEISKYIKPVPNIDMELRIAAELILREMDLPKKPSTVALGFMGLAQVYGAPVSEKDVKDQLVKFSNREKAEECRKKVEDLIRSYVQNRDNELNYVPAGDKLRNPSDYQLVFGAIHNKVFNEYAQYLKRDSKDNTKIHPVSKDAIRLLVEHLANIMYPDAAAPVNPNKTPVNMRKRAERLYHSSRQPDVYVVTQANMMREILTGAHYEHQFEFAEEEFDQIQRELSNREQKKKTFYEVEAAAKEIARRNEQFNYKLFPNKPRQDILESMTSNLMTKDGGIADMEKYQQQYGFAMVETLRLWLLDMMGPEEDPNQKIREMLGEMKGGNTLSMGLYANIGQLIGSHLLTSIEKDVVRRFPAGGKSRGAVGGGDDLSMSLDERANQMSLLGLEPIPDDCDGMTSFDEKKGPISHQSNMAEIQARAMAAQAAEDDGFSILSQGKRAAQSEVESYLVDLMGPMRFKTARTRKTRYETVEEARRKPRVALSAHTFGGFIQQLFWSKSPYLRSYLEDEKKFRNWFIVSVSASFGNNIGGRVDRQLRKLWGPNGKYESMDHFMESVGAFADPMWAVAPLTQAFGEREMQKRRSGYIADEPDTAENHLMRAAYNIPSLDPGEVEIYLKHYFNKRAWQIKCGFNGTDPDKIEEYLIKRYRRDPNVSRAENVSNNPFGKMDVEDLRRVFGSVGITVDSLEEYFGRVRLEYEKAEQHRLNYAAEYTREDVTDDLIMEQQRFEAKIEESNRYMIDGTRDTSDWILDNIDASDLGEEGKILLDEAVQEVKEELNRMVGSDIGMYMHIFNDMDNWTETIEAIVERMDSRFDPVKRYVTDQLELAKSKVVLTEKLKKEHEEKMLGLKEEKPKLRGETSEKIINDFEDKEKPEQKEKKRTVVRRRKPKEDDVPSSQTSESVPALEAIARALELKVETYKDEFFPSEDFEEEPMLAGEERLDPTLVNEALLNIQRYTAYLRRIRDEDITKQVGAEVVQKAVRDVNSLSAQGLIDKFVGTSYDDLVKKLQETFGLNKVSKLNNLKTMSVGSFAFDMNTDFQEDDNYYHFS